jgi:hypothetical protein
MVRDVNKVKAMITTGIIYQQDQAKRELEAFYRVIFQDAVNQNSIRTFNEAAQYQNAIVQEVRNYLDDRQCGSKYALENLKRFFETQGNNLVALGNIAGKAADAAKAAAPVANETVTILAELAQLTVEVNAKGIEAQRQYNILKKAIEELGQEAYQISQLNIMGVAGDFYNVVTTVGPMLVSCGTCAGLLADAIPNISVGMATTVGGVATCPASFEAAGGTCWILPGGIAIGGRGAIEGALSSIPCGYVVTNVNKIQEYVNNIAKFVNSTIELARRIKNSIQKLNTASEALVKLANQLGESARPRLLRIQQSIDRSVDAINSSYTILSTEVSPRVEKFSGNILQQIAYNTVTLANCHNKLKILMYKLGEKTFQAMRELSEALALLVDGGKIVTNLYNQSLAGINSAKQYVSNNWGSIENSYKSLYKRAFGVDFPTVNLFITIPHLTTRLATNLREVGNIITETGAIPGRIVNLVLNAVTQGKRAFLNLDNDKRSARGKFDIAGTKAQSALNTYKSLSSPPYIQAFRAISVTQIPSFISTLGSQKAVKVPVQLPLIQQRQLPIQQRPR